MVVTGLIAMSETNRLITGALDPQARSRSLTEVTGPLALADTEAWNTWEGLVDLREEVAAWIGLSAVFDLLFIAGYFLLVRQLVRHTRFPRRALVGLMRIDVLESALLLVGALALALGGVGWFRHVVAAVATAKWVLVAVLVTAVLRNDDLRHRLWTMTVRTARALRVQRLSLLVIVVFAALAVVPSPGIFDQFPDVIRSWFQSVEWRGVRHGLCATVAAALVALQLFAIGRQRSERVWSSRVGGRPPSEPAQWRWWLGGLLGAVLAAVLLFLASGGRLVHWPTVGWVVAVPGVVLLSSAWVARRRGPGLWSEEEHPLTRDNWQRARDVWVAGDVLAMAVVLVGALALVRALVAPVLLGPAGSRGATWSVRLVVLVAAAALAVAVVWLADRWVRWLDSDDRPTGGSTWGEVVRFLRPSVPGGLSAPLRRRGVVASWGAGILGLLGLMVRPVWFGELVGVVAIALLALGAWAFVLGLLIVHMQHRQPMAVFRLMKLRATPVLTLLLLTALLASLRGGDPQLHQLRTLPGEAPAVAPRDPLPVALGTWVRTREGCSVPAGGQRALPLVLVAASGGGIRAAYWTAGIMDQLKLAGGCAPSAVFLSSGVSGGSLGLALARGSTPMGDVRALTGSDALAAAVAGTLVGDLIAGTTGLRVPSYVSAEWAWRDRAGLMEEVWEEHARVLRGRWGPGDTGTSGVLVLNSTAAGPGCRVLVSQVRVDGAPVAADADPEDTGAEPMTPGCSTGPEQAPASFDLQQTYRRCTPDMSWATATMLSARFPTVTPAARVPSADGRTPGDDADCAPAEDVQLIDGGYAEGSGLGTLADVSTELMEAIRTHNAERAAGEPAVVPLVLYLEDETRTEIVEEPAELTPELFVPLVGRGAGAVQATTGTWLQRLAEAIAEPCAAADATGCADAAQAVRQQVGDGVVVAAPLTEPSVEAPLGWNLSWDSTTRLDDQLEHQGTGCAVPEETADPDGDPRPGGYPCLEDLIAVLTP